MNRGLYDREASIVMDKVIDSYHNEQDISRVKVVHDRPENIDLDDFIACTEQKWDSNDK